MVGNKAEQYLNATLKPFDISLTVQCTKNSSRTQRKSCKFKYCSTKNDS